MNIKNILICMSMLLGIATNITIIAADPLADDSWQEEVFTDDEPGTIEMADLGPERKKKEAVADFWQLPPELRREVAEAASYDQQYPHIMEQLQKPLFTSPASLDPVTSIVADANGFFYLEWPYKVKKITLGDLNNIETMHENLHPSCLGVAASASLIAVGANKGLIMSLGSGEAIVQLFDTNSWAIKRQLKTEVEDTLISLCISPKGQYVSACFNAHEIGIWDLTSPHPTVRAIEEHMYQASVLSWSAQEKLFVAGSQKGALAVINAEDGTFEKIVRHEGTPINAVSWQPMEPTIAAATANTIELWGISEDVATNRIVYTHTTPALCTACSFSPNGTLFVACFNDGSIIVWETNTWNQVGALKNKESINCVAWSKDSKKIATGSNHGLVSIWDVEVIHKAPEALQQVGLDMSNILQLIDGELGQGKQKIELNGIALGLFHNELSNPELAPLRPFFTHLVNVPKEAQQTALAKARATNTDFNAALEVWKAYDAQDGILNHRKPYHKEYSTWTRRLKEEEIIQALTTLAEHKATIEKGLAFQDEQLHDPRVQAGLQEMLAIIDKRTKDLEKRLGKKAPKNAFGGAIGG